MHFKAKKSDEKKGHQRKDMMFLKDEPDIIQKAIKECKDKRATKIAVVVDVRNLDSLAEKYQPKWWHWGRSIKVIPTTKLGLPQAIHEASRSLSHDGGLDIIVSPFIDKLWFRIPYELAEFTIANDSGAEVLMDIGPKGWSLFYLPRP